MDYLLGSTKAVDGIFDSYSDTLIALKNHQRILAFTFQHR